MKTDTVPVQYMQYKLWESKIGSIDGILPIEYDTNPAGAKRIRTNCAPCVYRSFNNNNLLIFESYRAN